MLSLGALPIGSLFARDFRVVQRLAAGGMGSVYQVEQLSTSRPRALKLLHPQLVADEQSRKRFVMEAQIGSQLDSDHVVEVVAAGIDEPSGVPWLAMELLRGRTLANVIDKQGVLPLADAREMARQLDHVLGQAHDIGLVHRDLKPENIFIAHPRRADVPFTLKLLDFGIAKLAQEAHDVMRNSQVIGSPLWMAPEQLERGTSILSSTDVWAIGLVFFHVLSGQIYWKSASEKNLSFGRLVVEIMSGHTSPASVRAQALGATLPELPGFDDWFAQCIEVDPVSRFPTATEALAELRDILDHTPQAHSAPSWPRISVLSRALADAPPAPSSGEVPPLSENHARELPTLSAPPGAVLDWLDELLEHRIAAAPTAREKAEAALRIARVLELCEHTRPQAIAAYERAQQFHPTVDARDGLASLRPRPGDPSPSPGG